MVHPVAVALAFLGVVFALVLGIGLLYRRSLRRRGQPVPPFFPATHPWGRRLRSADPGIESALRGLQPLLWVGFGLMGGGSVCALRSADLCLTLLFGWRGTARFAACLVVGLAVVGVTSLGLSMANPKGTCDGRDVARGLGIATAGGVLAATPAIFVGVALVAGRIAAADVGAELAFWLVSSVVMVALSGLPLAIYGKTLWRAGRLESVPTSSPAPESTGE